VPGPSGPNFDHARPTSIPSKINADRATPNKEQSMSTTREQVDIKETHRDCQSDQHQAVMAAQARDQQLADQGWNDQNNS
jgi:hypothetical protein